MKNIKHQILDTAIKLFNKSGFKNVAISQIASEIGISNGNLNYHFKKKDDLMLAIFERMDEEQGEILIRFKSYPNLKGFIEQTDIFYRFQLKYRFFYLDTLEIGRAYPKISEAHRKYSLRSIQHIRDSLEYGVKRGVFQLEPFPDAYDYLAYTIWMKGAFWLVQMEILQKDCKDTEVFIHSFTSLWQPYLTSKGLEELKAIKQLGITKNTNI